MSPRRALKRDVRPLAAEFRAAPATRTSDRVVGAPIATAEVELTESASVFEGGGGFQRSLWFVLVTPAASPLDEEVWIHPRELLDRPIQGFSVALDDDGAPISDDFDETPAGFWWKRTFKLRVPVGSRLRRLYSRPDRERTARDATLRKMLFRRTESFFTVLADGSLVSDAAVTAGRVPSARVALSVSPGRASSDFSEKKYSARPAITSPSEPQQPGAPVSTTEALGNIANILAVLGKRNV